VFGFAALLACGCEAPPDPGLEVRTQPVRIRVATYNIEDLRTEELMDPGAERLRAAAATIQRLRPDILVINEIPYDQEGAPDWQEGQTAGSNAQRFSENFLATSQGDALDPVLMEALMAPVNTGIASGHDLDNDGTIQSTYPPLPPLGQDSRSAEGRAYGGDAWGFGTYPGQYGMAILVRHPLQIRRDLVRTFQTLLWSRMPGALAPIDPESGENWYSPREWAAFRLASKSFWDVPVRLPNGSEVSFLLSHPSPPAFDGPEKRNQKRNHDEIRFWADYLDGADYIVDDAGRPGDLAAEALFVIVGDMNADPDEGGSLDNPIQRLILDHPRVQGEFVPRAQETPGTLGGGELDPDDTSDWGQLGMRVDYVLPSAGIEILGGAVVRPDSGSSGFVHVSDHFVVYLDLSVPPRARERSRTSE
jgi:endonuclease/exonuclease/phosphatase family metal-dependent hydrolase